LAEEKIDTTVSAGAEDTAAATAAAAAAAAPTDKGPDAKALADENALLKRTLADKDRVIGEKDQAVQYWHGQAKGAKQPADDKQPPAEAEDTTDLLDLIGTKGAKGLDDYLKAKGFVKGSDVAAAVNTKAQEISREAGVVGRFPELKDQNSEMFKATARHFAELEAEGIKGTRATEVATAMAYAELLEAGKITPRGKKAAEPNAGGTDDDQRESDRLRRVRAQEGDNGRRTGGGGGGKDDELDPVQKRMVEAFGITEEAYKKRAKEGVQFARP
jgi:hypothetical protein